MLTSAPSISGTRDSILIFMRSEPFAQSIKKTFDASGFQSATVCTEGAAIAAVREAGPALIIIDRQFTTESNLRQLRAVSAAPIVAVQVAVATCADDECAKDYEHDVDLVVCSQSPRELLARVRAILRRRVTQCASNMHYNVGKIRMDLDRHEVTVSGRLVELTPKEFQILRQFLEFPNRLFSRQEMLNKVWGEGYALEEHALDVHIHSLRQKVESNPADPRAIVTVRGIGYKLRA
jgi:two-component system, OmpR family, response regulator RegX3